MIRPGRGLTSAAPRALVLVVVLATPASARGAAACRVLRYTFQTAARASAPGATPDLPPQIAVWIATADGAAFVDTLMVTNSVALFGIGNRPGRWDLPSGPRFPYGARDMVLPIWAHARGRTYPAVVMADGRDDELMNHERTSSPEPYFCVPATAREFVDAVTCPSGFFRSAKGILAPAAPARYYPPRGDLVDTLAEPCPPLVNRPGGSCDFGDADQYAVLNDLDAVAAATPASGVTFTGSWRLPTGLAPGAYALFVEVAKEYDANDSYHAASSRSAREMLEAPDFGVGGNLGQPSVLFRVALTLGSDADQHAGVDAPLGYGDWRGATGAVFPVDATLDTLPGTGSGRLAALSLVDAPGGGGRARVWVDETACAVATCEPSRPLPTSVPLEVRPVDLGATMVTVTLRQGSDDGAAPLGYELRYRQMAWQQSFGPDDVDHWVPGPLPVPGAPGAEGTVTLTGLVPDTWYVVGVRARGACADSAASYVRFKTTPIHYQKLSGCFIVTAAFADADVAAVRRARDAVVRRAALAAVAVDLYEQSAPPLASLVRHSELLRALTRTALRPVVGVLRTFFGNDPGPGRSARR